MFTETSRPLTASDGKFYLNQELRKFLCLMDDGKLLISRSHTFNPHVRGFIARLKHMNHPFQPVPVDLSEIEAAYAETSPQKSAAASNMQKEARALFERAVTERASDIHIRVSGRAKTRILFRIHNDLEFKDEHPTEYGVQLCTTIYQSMTDVSDATFETLSRQDARISEREKLPAKLDGIRIGTSPQVDGFVMVMRLLYNDTTDSIDLSLLGFEPQQAGALGFMKRRPNGINVIGGPTGSGKSTTLQRVLIGIAKESNEHKHIITVEDPPEYPIPGAVQTPVTNAATESDRSQAFQDAIKATMRLDPDVIMIGEVRDTPSARLTFQAGMTGHQVWTTVHANNAFAIFARLIDLGIPVELVADPSLVTGLVCQRLLKVLCPRCKVPLHQAIGRYNDSDLRQMMSVIQIDRAHVRGEGCDHCRGSGTIGRTVVAETIIPDHHLMTHVRNRDSIRALDYWLREQGGVSMRDDAIHKINDGMIDPFHADEVVGPLATGSLAQRQGKAGD